MRGLGFFILLVLIILASGLNGQESELLILDMDVESVSIEYIDSLNKVAFSVFRSDPSETRKLALKSLALSSEIDYRKGEGKAYNYIAMFYHINGSYDSSFIFYNKALNIFESSKDSLNIGKILNNLALLFSHREYYNLSLEYNYKSLEIAEKMNDNTSRFHSYNNIGITYEKLGEYERAIEFYELGLDVLQLEGLSSELYYYALGNLGIINLLTNQYDTARSQIKEGLAYFIQEENNYGIAQSYRYLAELEIETRNYKLAENYLKKSNDYRLKIEDKKLLATNRLLEARLYFRKSEFIKARKVYQELIPKSHGMKYVEIEMESYFQISEIDSIFENYRSALHFYKAGMAIKDSIKSLKIQNQIAELEIQYESLKKDKDIHLLKSNQELQELKIKKHLTQEKFLWIILLSIMSTVIIGVFAYFRIQNKNKLLSIQNEEISSKNFELNYHKEHLEEVVDQRTSELKKAKEKAEESDRLKSSFLATMSHELRTPLNAIIGFSDLFLSDEVSSNEEKIFIQTIHDNGNHLLGIVEELFDISIIEAGQTKIINEEVDVNLMMDGLSEVVMMEQVKLQKEHLKIQLKKPENELDTDLVTDAVRLRQILLNLIKNAIKFTNNGSIDYGYEIKSKDNKKELWFFVKDTGIGIGEEKKELIFQLFRQVEDSYTKQYEGIGIGLSISQKLTQLLGGEIWFESTVGKGSIFYVKLPFNC